MKNIAQPIRDKDTVEEIKLFLKETNQRNYIMFLLGINAGLRISDLLKLRVKDVEGLYITMRENKTKDFIRIWIPTHVKKELRKFTSGKPKLEFLFKSRQGRNSPISRNQAYNILKQVEREFNLECISTHTLRKTFGYHVYMDNKKDIALVQKLLNHESAEDTLRYIGIEQDHMDNARRKLKL